MEESKLSKEAKSRQEATEKLLFNNDDTSDEDDEIKRVGKKVGKLILTAATSAAATLVMNEDRISIFDGIPVKEGENNLTSSLLKRTTSKGNIIQRMPDRVIDATDTICSFPNCVRTLNIAVTRFHCRKCNGWYCGQHAGHPSFGMKLLPGSGEADRVKGVWSRVCLRCFDEKFYKSANEMEAMSRSRMSEFLEKRKICIDRIEEKVNLLRGRFQVFSKYFERKSRKEALNVFERRVVEWEGDDVSDNCRICQLPFTTVKRKHHCRLCGRLICGHEECSNFHNLIRNESFKIRICFDCDSTLFNIKVPDISRSSLLEEDVIKMHGELFRVRQQIDDILPRFQDQLDRFERELEQVEPVEEKLLESRHEAMAARDTLMLLFRHYQKVASEIKEISTCSDDGDEEDASVMMMKLLCDNIHRTALIYLQRNMFTLQLLPKLDLQRLQKNVTNSTTTSSTVGGKVEGSKKTPSIFSFFTSNRQEGEESLTKYQPPLPANFDALREKVGVWDEQREQLRLFLSVAVQEHRFEDVRSLRSSLVEVEEEIVKIKKILNQYM